MIQAQRMSLAVYIKSPFENLKLFSLERQFFVWNSLWWLWKLFRIAVKTLINSFTTVDNGLILRSWSIILFDFPLIWTFLTKVCLILKISSLLDETLKLLAVNNAHESLNKSFINTKM